MAMKFGLLLPHFGEHADRKKLMDGAQHAEELGFDSVWVRDHLLFEPHGEFESSNKDFYEPLTVLSAIGAVTDRITLGTATLIPYRHPLTVAHALATITHVAGPRVIAGWGAGTFDHEFEAVGLGGIFRPELVESTVSIMRAVWNGDDVSYHDNRFSFSGATIHPKPAGPIPIWYGGATPASAKGSRVLRRMDPGKDHAADHREAGRFDANHRRREWSSDADGSGSAADHDRRNPRGCDGRYQRRRPAPLGERARQVVGKAGERTVRDGGGHRRFADRRHSR